MSKKRSPINKPKAKPEKISIFKMLGIIIPAVSILLAFITNFDKVATNYHTLKDFLFPPKFDNTNCFNILILPFERLEKQTDRQYNLERQLLKRLEEKKSEEKLNIQVIYDERDIYPKTSKEADSIARARDAKLILYGDVYELNSSANLKYVFITDTVSNRNDMVEIKLSDMKNISPETDIVSIAGETGNKEIHMADIANGELQRDPDAIIYWALSLEAYQKSDYLRVLYLINRIPLDGLISPLPIFKLKALSLSGRMEFQNSISVYSKIDSLVSNDYYNHCARGYAYSQLHNYNEALKDYTKAIEINSDYCHAFLLRGQLYKDINEFHLAINDFNKVIEIDSNQIRAFALRGSVYMSLFYNRLALWNYNYCINKGNLTSNNFLNRGIVYKRIGEFELALNDLNEAIRLNNLNHLAYFNRGLFFIERGNWQQATKDLEFVIAWDKKFITAYVLLAICYKELNELDKEMQVCNKAIDIDDRFAEIHNFKGFILLNQEKYSEAMKEFNKSVELNPKYAYAYSNRGFTYFKMGYIEEALADYKISQELDAKNAFVYRNRGLTYFSMGKYKLALQEMEKAISLDGQNKFENELRPKIEEAKKLLK